MPEPHNAILRPERCHRLLEKVAQGYQERDLDRKGFADDSRPRGGQEAHEFATDRARQAREEIRLQRES